MVSIGKIKEIPIRLREFHWEISGFFSILLKDGDYICSPQFSFAEASWCLVIYPNGSSVHESIGYIGMYLCRKSSGPPIQLEYCLGLQTVKGHQVKQEHRIKVFENTETASGVHKWLSRADLMERKSQIMSDDVITLFCNLKDLKSTEVTTGNDPEHADVEASTHRVEASTQTVEASTQSVEEKCEACATGYSTNPQEKKVLHDFKELFLNKEDCDVTIKVEGSEFPAHRAILKVRSPVFASTFRHHMKENATGILEIEDCSSSSFSDFLCFLYCGDVGIISLENIFGLFTLADKYQVLDLRSKCLEFIKMNLTVDTFCETITLALRHSETELIKLSTDYFKKNVPKIIVTVKWQTFLAENPTEGNELFVKYFVPNSS